jgi:hypothetical protein
MVEHCRAEAVMGRIARCVGLAGAAKGVKMHVGMGLAELL